MTSAAVRLTAPPSPEELIARAKAMIPEIRKRAEETERNRTISPRSSTRSAMPNCCGLAGRSGLVASSTTRSLRSKLRSRCRRLRFDGLGA